MNAKYNPVLPKKVPTKSKKPSKEIVLRWLEETIPRCRRCPSCWGNRKGWGVQYGRTKIIAYYRCRLCGHTWTADVPPNAVIQASYHDLVVVPDDIRYAIGELDYGR